MCFSQPASLFFFICGVSASILIHRYARFIDPKRHFFLIGPLLYFSLMEFLQFCQYLFINECSNSWNIFLSFVGYIHIAFQPLAMLPWYLYFVPPATRKRYAPILFYLCAIGGLLMIARLKIPLFGYTDYAQIIWGEKVSTTCSEGIEALCSATSNWCTYQELKAFHLAWKVPLRHCDTFYFSPGISLHAFLFFAIPIALGLVWLTAFLIIVGPILAYYLADGDVNRSPAIWCFWYIPTLICTLILIARKCTIIRALTHERLLHISAEGSSDDSSNSSKGSLAPTTNNEQPLRNRKQSTNIHQLTNNNRGSNQENGHLQASLMAQWSYWIFRHTIKVKEVDEELWAELLPSEVECRKYLNAINNQIPHPANIPTIDQIKQRIEEFESKTS